MNIGNIKLDPTKTITANDFLNDLAGNKTYSTPDANGTLNLPALTGLAGGTNFTDRFNSLVGGKTLGANAGGAGGYWQQEQKVNPDALWNMYRDQYIRNGRLAMQDTIGQTTALTGGYGNSYAQSAGQQAYHGYLAQLNEMWPKIYGDAAASSGGYYVSGNGAGNASAAAANGLTIPVLAGNTTEEAADKVYGIKK